MAEPVIYGQFFNGESALGKLEQAKLYSTVNCDIHSETGMIMPQLAMESESTTPNEACFSAIDNSGNMYFCSKTTGKIWKRTTSAVYSLIRTNANGAHTGCQYFNGYLFYWTATELGTYDLASTYNDSFATGTAFRGSAEHANALYIANGRWIARVDSANTFSATELVLPAQYLATCLKSLGDDLLIGTYVNTGVAYCKVFLWDTVSTSWTYEDEVFEVGINCFVQIDNIMLAQCGTSGRFYYWTGSQMAYFGSIRGITTALGEQMAVTFNGRSLFANTTKIWSIHKQDKDLPYAFCCEYTCTGTVASLAVQGQTLLASVGTGVNKRGTTYATATFETPEAQIKASRVIVSYDAYPTGIGIEVKTNGSAYVAKTEITNTNEMIAYYDGGLPTNVNAQARITLTPSGANIPKVKSVMIMP